MRILIADDDPVSRLLLERTLRAWGHDPVVTHDGLAAWQEMARPDAPLFAILDWMMPGLDGLDLCRRISAQGRVPRPYVVLLTAHGGKANRLAGLASGADDYLTKPLDADELQARVQVGMRVLDLQQGLAQRIRELESAIAQIKHLQGLLPICMYCKKIRIDPNYWQQVEAYLAHHTDARFSHGICPDCYEGVVKPEVDRFQRECANGAARPPCATPSETYVPDCCI
jgi:CheY-like chemotaxis protein